MDTQPGQSERCSCMAEFDPNETFELADYNPEWPTLFQQEADKIAAVIGDAVIEVEHIGSTSIPGIRAKPIIDILLIVEHFAPLDEYRERLEPLGYHIFAHKDFNQADHLFFWKGMPRTHHLHIVEYATWEHQRHLLFRDYLRNHPEVAEQYEQVKRELSIAFKSNRPAYTKGKTAFIKPIVAFAMEEINNPSEHPTEDAPDSDTDTAE